MHPNRAFRASISRLMAMEQRLLDARAARDDAWHRLAESADPQARAIWLPPFATRITAERMDDKADGSWTHGLRNQDRDKAKELLDKGSAHARVSVRAADMALDQACADASRLMVALLDHLLEQPCWTGGDPMLVLALDEGMVKARLLDASVAWEKFHATGDGSIGGGSLSGAVRLGSPSFGLALRLAASTRGVRSGHTWHMTMEGETTTLQARTARAALAWVVATRFHALPRVQEVYDKIPWVGTPKTNTRVPPKLVREEPSTVRWLSYLHQVSTACYPDGETRAA